MQYVESIGFHCNRFSETKTPKTQRNSKKNPNNKTKQPETQSLRGISPKLPCSPEHAVFVKHLSYRCKFMQNNTNKTHSVHDTL